MILKKITTIVIIVAVFLQPLSCIVAHPLLNMEDVSTVIVAGGSPYCGQDKIILDDGSTIERVPVYSPIKIASRGFADSFNWIIDTNLLKKAIQHVYKIDSNSSIVVENLTINRGDAIENCYNLNYQYRDAVDAVQTADFWVWERNDNIYIDTDPIEMEGTVLLSEL